MPIRVGGKNLTWDSHSKAHWENAKKVWYYEKWVWLHASLPPKQSVKKHQLELVVWTNDIFSGSYSPNFFRLSFLSSGFSFFYFEVFLLNLLAYTVWSFFQLFCEFCSKNTRFSSPFHICTESSLSNREEKKRCRKKVHHSVAASSCEIDKF